MPAPSLCVISGVVYDENGVPAVGVTIYLTKVLLNGVLIGTAPIGSATIPGPSGDHHVQYIEAITSIAGGVVSFTVPQLSTVYLEGNVSGYNNGEIALSIPATATATLEALTPATFPIDVTTFTFLALVDTPDAFTGQALKNVRVNAAGTALEFSAPVVVDNETVQDALSAFFPDVAPFDWTYDDAGDRVTLAILDATASARGLMSTAYATKLDAITAFGLSLADDANAAAGRTTLELSSAHSPTFTGLTLTALLSMPTNANAPTVGTSSSDGIGISAGGNFSSYVAGSRIARVGATQSIILSGAQFAWDANATGVTGTTDVGLARRAAGVLRTTNGSTGSGQLLIGSSTDTIAAQLHTLSNAIGVIPLIAEGPAGQTANLFEARVNGATLTSITAAGGLLLPDGSAAAPSLARAAGVGTGFRFAANTMVFAAAGNDFIVLDANGFTARATSAVQWGSSGIGSPDLSLVRSAASVLRIGNASTGGGGLQFTERTAPAAPATNNVILYAEDNGSGKTKLMAIFPTGAAVQIAIEP